MISIVYHPTSIDDFRSAVQFMKDQGITTAAPVVSRPAAKEEDGPFVSRYKAESGKTRFRLSEDERNLMQEKSLTIEDIAQIRLEGYESVVSEKPLGSLERPQGLSIFAEEEEES